MQAIILAGGLGTRLRPFTENHSKAMYPIEGIPFLEHIIIQVKSWGITKILLLLGYKADEIIEYFQVNKSLGVEISSKVTPVEWNTGSRIRDAKDLIEDEFILLYCDNYCPIDYDAAYRQFKNSGNLIQITAYANKDGYTKNNVKNIENQVYVYDKNRKEEGLSAVDIGYAFIKKQILANLPDSDCNFENEVYSQVVSMGKMGCYVEEQRYYSIGSWERIELTKDFFRPRNVIFLDRDGTINERPPKACYVEKPQQFKWLPGSREALQLLKENDYEIYLVTNQPGIARGNLTWEMLDAIHDKMCQDLLEYGAKIDDIFICPHNWDEGCDCRKPKPGLLYKAQRDHSLNLKKCLLVGDDERDIEAGKSAGVANTFLVDEKKTLFDVVCDLCGGKKFD